MSTVMTIFPDDLRLAFRPGFCPPLVQGWMLFVSSNQHH